MSTKKTTAIIVMTLVIYITGSWNILFAQAAGDNDSRNIMRKARQKKLGTRDTATEQQESGKTSSRDLMKMRRGDAADQTTYTPRPKPAAAASVATPTPITTPPITQVVQTATAVVEADELLNLLPENCLLFLRINNLDASLGALDQYISGASPIPISLAMLAKMQLGQLLNDQMLNGIDTQGDFVVFATPVSSSASAPSPMPQMLVGMLVPTKGTAFSQSHPESIIANTKYALITLKATSPDLATTVKQEMLTTSLAPSLSSDEINSAKTAPAWAYVNIEKAVELMGPMAFAQLDQAMEIVNQAAAAQPEVTEANAQMATMYIQMLKQAATQTKSISINITPNPGDLNLDFTLSAIPDTDLAALLQKDPAMQPGYALAGFLNEPAAINFLAKTNKPLFETLNAVFTDMFAGILAEAMPADQIDNWKALVADSANNMGSEFAASISVAPGMPPITIKEIIQVKNPENFLEMMQQSLDFVNGMYKSMNLPLALSISPDSQPYKQTKIYTLNIDAQLPPNATDEQKQIYQAMSATKINCKFAPVTDLMLVTLAPDAEQQIQTLIDQALSATLPAPTGDIKIALDTIPDSANTDLIASVNVVRLISEIGKMLTSMPIPATQMIGQMLSQMDAPTQSCLCIAGTVENASANLQIALPKQHLMEITTIAMKLQQMQTQMQNNQPQQ